MPVRAVYGHAVQHCRLAASSVGPGRHTAFAATERCVIVRAMANPETCDTCVVFDHDIECIALHHSRALLAVALADGSINVRSYGVAAKPLGAAATAPRHSPEPGRTVSLTFIDDTREGTDRWALAGVVVAASDAASHVILVSPKDSFAIPSPATCVTRLSRGLVGLAQGTNLALGRLLPDGIDVVKCNTLDELRGARFVDVVASGGHMVGLTNAGFIVAFDTATGAVDKWMDCKVCPAVHLAAAPGVIIVVGNVIRVFDDTTWAFLGKVKPVEQAGQVSQSFFSGLLAPPTTAAVITDGVALCAFNPAGDLLVVAMSEERAGSSSEGGGSSSKRRIEFTTVASQSCFLLGAPNVPCSMLSTAAGTVCWVSPSAVRCGSVDDRGRVTVSPESGHTGAFIPNASCVVDRAAEFFVCSERHAFLLSTDGTTVAGSFDLDERPVLAASYGGCIAVVSRDSCRLYSASSSTGQHELSSVLQVGAEDAVAATVVDGVFVLVDPKTVRFLPLDGSTDYSLLGGDPVDLDTSSSSAAAAGVRRADHAGCTRSCITQARNRALWANGASIVAFDPLRASSVTLPTGLPHDVDALQVEPDEDLLAAACVGAAAIVCLKNAVTLHTVSIPSQVRPVGLAFVSEANTLVCLDALCRNVSVELLVKQKGASPSPTKHHHQQQHVDPTVPASSSGSATPSPDRQRRATKKSNDALAGDDADTAKAKPGAEVSPSPRDPNESHHLEKDPRDDDSHHADPVPPRLDDAAAKNEAEQPSLERRHAADGGDDDDDVDMVRLDTPPQTDLPDIQAEADTGYRAPPATAAAAPAGGGTAAAAAGARHRQPLVSPLEVSAAVPSAAPAPRAAAGDPPEDGQGDVPVTDSMAAETLRRERERMVLNEDGHPHRHFDPEVQTTSPVTTKSPSQRPRESSPATQRADEALPDTPTNLGGKRTPGDGSARLEQHSSAHSPTAAAGYADGSNLLLQSVEAFRCQAAALCGAPESYRESLAAELVTAAQQLHRPAAMRASASLSLMGGDPDASMEVSLLRSEMRELRRENERISQQNEQILELLRSTIGTSSSRQAARDD